MRVEQSCIVWFSVVAVVVACHRVDEVDGDSQIDGDDAGADADTDSDMDSDSDADSDTGGDGELCADLAPPEPVLEADDVPGLAGALRFTDIALTNSPTSPFDTALLGEVETSTEAVDPVLVLFDVGPALDGSADVAVAPLEDATFSFDRALSVVQGYALFPNWYFVTLQCGLVLCSLAGLAGDGESEGSFMTILDYYGLTFVEPRGLGRLDAEIWIYGDGLWFSQWEWTIWSPVVDPETGSPFNAMASIPLADAYGAAVGNAGRILETGFAGWIEHPPITAEDLLAVALRGIDVSDGEFAAGGRGGVIVDRNPETDELRVFEAVDSDVTALAWIDQLAPILEGGTAAGELFAVAYAGDEPAAGVCHELDDEVVALEVVEHAGCDHLLVLTPNALHHVPLPCDD